VQIGTRRRVLPFCVALGDTGVRRRCTVRALTSTEVDPWRCPPGPVASAHPQQHARSHMFEPEYENGFT